MIHIGVVLFILTVHFIADFLLQSNKMAQNKSKSFKWLSYHVMVYSIFTSIMWIMLGLDMFAVMALTFIPHMAIDFVTSKFTRALFKKQSFHWFFAVVGFDQLLHYVSLLYMYKLLS